MTNPVEITLSISTARAELDELKAVAMGNPVAEHILAELVGEEGENFIRIHQVVGRQTALHLEAVLCDEARALLQVWRAAA